MRLQKFEATCFLWARGRVDFFRVAFLSPSVYFFLNRFIIVYVDLGFSERLVGRNSSSGLSGPAVHYVNVLLDGFGCPQVDFLLEV